MDPYHSRSDSGANQRPLAPDDIDLARSHGVVIQIGDHRLLDATGLEATRLGWHASPLLGVAHYQPVWSGDTGGAEWQRVVRAFQSLRRRIEDREFGPWIASLGDQLANRGATSDPVDTIRGYIAMSMLDQFPDAIGEFERTSRERVGEWVASPDGHLKGATVEGLDIHLEFATAAAALERWRSRRAHGLELRPPEGNRLTLCGSLAARGKVRELFWRRLDRWVTASPADQEAGGDEDSLAEADLRDRYELLGWVLNLRQSGTTEAKATESGAPQSGAIVRTGADASQNPLELIQTQLEHVGPRDLRAHWLDRDNYPRYRQQILDLQQAVYEPARQSPAEEFDAIFESDRPVAIIVTEGQRIVAMGLAGPLPRYRSVRGTERDPFADDPHVLYMVDVTVLPEYRGGLGRLIKSAVVIRALQQGYSAIHGRNRDRVARGMWAINLSLGSYELQHLVDDYPDQLPHRDCLYYRCPLKWDARITLSSPLDQQAIVERIHGRRRPAARPTDADRQR